MTGTLYGLGVGPGAPDLITLRGLRILQSAPVLTYPAPLEGDSLARRIVAPHLDGHHQEIVIRMPMVAERFPAQAVYDWAAARIGEQLAESRDVVYLCEGDPFVYGSFSYLYERMIGAYPVTVVPGVSSVMACAAAVGAPLAMRNDVLSIVPATLSEDVLTQRIGEVDAVAIIKVGRHLPKVRRVLDSLDLMTAARYVERATFSNEHTMALADFTDVEAPYFSMVLVHRRGLAWRTQ
ncbi:MAG: precorrin-2 C(20)-methyltransferase [Gammaproteobacteria bacterium]|nr:precorrin-2 C(20)-methyltransferase [Gammaproteobacteria bacterium]